MKKMLVALLALMLLGLAACGAPVNSNAVRWEPVVLSYAEPMGTLCDERLAAAQAILEAYGYDLAAYPGIVAPFSTEFYDYEESLRIHLHGFSYSPVICLVRMPSVVITDIEIYRNGFEQWLSGFYTPPEQRHADAGDFLRIWDLNNDGFADLILESELDRGPPIFFLWDDAYGGFVENNQLRQLADESHISRDADGRLHRHYFDEEGVQISHTFEFIDGEFIAVQEWRSHSYDEDDTHWHVTETFTLDEDGEFVLTEIMRRSQRFDTTPRTRTVEYHVSILTEEVHKLIDGEMQLYNSTRTEAAHGYP